MIKRSRDEKAHLKQDLHGEHGHGHQFRMECVASLLIAAVIFSTDAEELNLHEVEEEKSGLGWKLGRNYWRCVVEAIQKPLSSSSLRSSWRFRSHASIVGHIYR